MDFPKHLIKGPRACKLFEEREALIHDLNTNCSCDRSLTLWNIKVLTKKLCAATGIPYPERERRL